MKREGRQHGIARTYPVCPNQPNLARLIKSSSSPLIVGTFTPVPPKPTTNHSKYIGRCGTRHNGKSKNNIKGSHKLRWHDAVSNHGVAARWAEEGSRFHSGYCYGGVSVAGLLEKLAIDADRDDDGCQDNDHDCENP
ncbi:unnamed protein product [Linum trigynum]|uniref:Uncharacterized protein n=1 Tax=Linum trigynum TaxID=586398 RepID=A0AAV2EZW2_9ROSI